VKGGPLIPDFLSSSASHSPPAPAVEVRGSPFSCAALEEASSRLAAPGPGVEARRFP